MALGFVEVAAGEPEVAVVFPFLSLGLGGMVMDRYRSPESRDGLRQTTAPEKEKSISRFMTCEVN